MSLEHRTKRIRTTSIAAIAMYSTVIAGLMLTAALSSRADTSDPALNVANSGATRRAIPEYDAQGRLKFPDDYRTWIHAGTSLGLKYRKDVTEDTPREKKPSDAPMSGDFHSVYIDPEAYETFRKTGKFPDPTILVMEVHDAKEREPKNIVSAGLFSADLKDVEVAVKNSRRPDGSTTEWAYYAFPDPTKASSAEAFKDADCFACHQKHADVDNVWVQFYPTLRRLRPDGAPNLKSGR
jgi:hypothetical protein